MTDHKHTEAGGKVELMPERIWATRRHGLDGWLKLNWSQNPNFNQGTGTEYVRADLCTPNAEAVTEGMALEDLKRDVHRNHLIGAGWSEKDIAEAEKEDGDLDYGYQYGAMGAVDDAIDYLVAVGFISSPPPARIDEPDIGKMCAALEAFENLIGEGGGIYDEDGDCVVSPNIVETIRAALSSPAVTVVDGLRAALVVQGRPDLYGGTPKLEQAFRPILQAARLYAILQEANPATKA